MKVFAHYMGNEKDWNLSEDGFQYRWRTLLKFGDSWNVIGSVIMKNPGSAQPLKSEISKAESDALALFDKRISLPFRLSDSYNFPASLTSRFRKTVHSGSSLKLYIPSTLKFDRKAGFLAFAPSTSVRDKEQSAATVCIRQHALAETEDSICI